MTTKTKAYVVPVTDLTLDAFHKSFLTVKNQAAYEYSYFHDRNLVAHYIAITYYHIFTRVTSRE